MSENRAAYRKFHFIYKTTCIPTGKYYIGMHSTDDLSDGYLGSGKRLRYSVKKHGIENHVREIVEMLPDRESLRLREAQIVGKDRLSDPICMNLVEGGNPKVDPNEFCGHKNPFFGRKHTQESLQKISNALKGCKRSEQFKEKISRAVTGRKHSAESKNRIGVANAVSLLGNKHSPQTLKKMSETHLRRCEEERESGKAIARGKAISRAKRLSASLAKPRE